MNKLGTAARLVLGLIFVVFGANFFLHFLPQPPMEEAGMKFAGALFETGYIFPIIKVVEVVSGLALLSGFFVPLALVVLAPIVLNIFLFHTILAPSGAPLAIVVFVLEIFLAWTYRSRYASLFAAK